MNIKKIYKEFYETSGNEGNARMEMCRETVLQKIESCGVSKQDFLTIEALVSELLNVQEEEAFKDGFCAGINHITQAMSFANARLQR